MQELEYWDDKPRYTGLPEPEGKPQIEERKMIAGGTE